MLVAHTPDSKTTDAIIQDQCKPHCHSQEEQPLLKIAQDLNVCSYKLRCRAPKQLLPRRIRQNQLAAAYLARLVDDRAKLRNRTDLAVN